MFSPNQRLQIVFPYYFFALLLLFSYNFFCHDFAFALFHLFSIRDYALR